MVYNKRHSFKKCNFSMAFSRTSCVKLILEYVFQSIYHFFHIFNFNIFLNNDFSKIFGHPLCLVIIIKFVTSEIPRVCSKAMF